MRIIIFLTLILISLNSFAQKKGIIDNQAIQFELKTPNDIIDFIVVDTVLTSKKPIFLFCQGSMPIPLFMDFNQAHLFMFGGGISNFNIEEIKKEYHIVVISMPKIPLIVKSENLDNKMCFVPDSTNNSYSKAYYIADNLDNYVNRATKVLNFLQKQSWVSNEKKIIFGHSQGSKIATKLASLDNSITHIGLAGANPFGRIDQMIREERRDAEKGKKSWEEAEKGIEYWNQLWKYINIEDIKDTRPDLLSWKSFSKPTYDDLLKIDNPIYLTYGTEDITSELCDLLPILFTSNNKDNLTIKRRFGLEHNFFELDKTGNPNYEKCHWNEVIIDFMKWIKEN